MPKSRSTFLAVLLGCLTLAGCFRPAPTPTPFVVVIQPTAELSLETPIFPPTVAPVQPIPVAGPPYPEQNNALQDIGNAMVAAQADNKFVVLDFGANWCPGCLVLHSYFEQEPLKTLLTQYFHVVSIDIGRYDKNLDLAVQYGDVVKAGIPALVIMEPTGVVRFTTRNGELAPLPALPIEQVYTIINTYKPS